MTCNFDCAQGDECTCCAQVAPIKRSVPKMDTNLNDMYAFIPVRELLGAFALLAAFFAIGGLTLYVIVFGPEAVWRFLTQLF